MDHRLVGNTSACCFAALLLGLSAACCWADTVGYYRFESDGFLADSSGGGRNLTSNTGNHPSVAAPADFLNPIPATGAANATGIDVVAASAGLLSAADDDAWTGNQFTLEAMISPLTLGATRIVVGQWDSTALAQRSWYLSTLSNGGIRLALSTDGANQTLIDSFQGWLLPNRSYYMAASFQVGSAIGPNGENVIGTAYLQDLTAGGPLMSMPISSTADVTALFASSAPLTVGSTGNPANHFDGVIDEVRVSNTPLAESGLLAYYTGVPRKRFSAISGVMADPTIDGTLVSLTVDTGLSQTTYRASDLIGATLTQFGGQTTTGIADIITPVGTTTPPASGDRAGLLGDTLLDTGFVNMSGWAVAFAEDIENRDGPDILLLDWGGADNADTVDIAIGGTTLDNVRLSDFSILAPAGSMAGRRRFTSAEGVFDVASLESVALTAAGTTGSNNNVIEIDLSDFGYAPGAFLTAGTEVAFSDGQGIDPVAIYGLREPVGLPGDFNGDGAVDAADYTVWRDNLGAADETALNGNGNGAGGVDSGDFELWKISFGMPTAGALSAVDAASVPEPATLSAAIALGLCGACGRLLARRRSRPHVR